MDEVALSIVIPVYNAAPYLQACLNSILSERRLPLEVIAVDDGSTDESPAILRQIEQDDPRVHVLFQQNQYAGAARNLGIAAARGKYMAFLDADDVFLSGALQSMYEQMERHRLDMIKGGFVYLDEPSGRTYTDLYAQVCSIGAIGRRIVLAFHQAPHRLMQVPDVPWNGMYRRAFLDAHGIRFNKLRCVNDRSFYIDCLIHARRLMVTNKPLVRYRVGRDDSLIGRKAKHFECHIASYAIVRDLCKGLSPKLRQIVLQKELTEVIGWYERLSTKVENNAALTSQLTAFLRDMDEADVGEGFLRRFSYSAYWYRLKYGQEPPKRPSALARAWYCWREHGLRYTWNKLRGKEGETWTV